MADGPAYYTGTMNIAQNDDWIVAFTYVYVDDSGNTTGPVDLSTSTLKLQIRRIEAEHEAIVTAISPATITIDDALNGKFTIRITREMIVRLPPGIYVSDLVRLDATTGYQERIFSADVTVVQGTSR
jgi:hypothetical protein